MVVQKQIRQKIEAEFAPTHMELENESHMHSVPENSETHFRLILVSEKFSGISRVQRQRMVNEVIKDELAGPVHAFSQRTYTPEEWGKVSGVVASPNCRGGTGL